MVRRQRRAEARGLGLGLEADAMGQGLDGRGRGGWRGGRAHRPEDGDGMACWEGMVGRRDGGCGMRYAVCGAGL
jgi:hypothetical protein